jgi:hypothetical protein
MHDFIIQERIEVPQTKTCALFAAQQTRKVTLQGIMGQSTKNFPEGSTLRNKRLHWQKKCGLLSTVAANCAR